MNTKIRLFKQACASMLAMSAVVMSGHALAVPVTLAGSHVHFSFDDALLGLYGMPVVSGNNLVFSPTEFKAISANREGIRTTSSTINIQVKAKANSILNGFSLIERGDYSLLGNGPQVLVGGQMRAYDLASPNRFVTNLIKTTASLNDITTFDENFETTNWEAHSAITKPSHWSNGVKTLENILKGRTVRIDSEAFIEKKYVSALVTVSAVPEAETYAMMLAGLGLVGLMVRRSHRTA